jgi:tetratricopeptide (TPR) repeat protein
LPLPGFSATGDSAADLGAKASAFESLSRHSEAIAAWQQVLSGYSSQYYDCAPAMLGLGKAYAAMGDSKNATQQFSNLLAAYSVGFRQESAQALLGLGGIAEGQGKHDQALSHYVRLLNEYPDMAWQCAEAKLRTAACYQSLRQQDKQTEALTSLLKDYPGEHDRCAQARMTIAQMQLKQGKGKDAESQLLKVVTDYPGLVLWRAEALLQLGAIRSKAGQLDSALGAYGRLLSECKYASPQRMRALMARGAVFEKMGKREQALGAYAAARQLSTVALGKESQELYEKSGVGFDYPRLRTERMQAIMQEGRAYRYLGEYPRAEEQFEKAAGEYGDTEEWRAQAYLEIADTQRQAGLAQNALVIYKDIIKSNPSMISVCALATLGKGQAYEQLKQQDAAIEEYRIVRTKYAAMREQCGAAVGASVYILLSQKRYGAAIAEADSFAVECASDSRWNCNALGWKGAAEMVARRYNDAALTLQQLIGKYPDRKDAVREASILLVQALITAKRPNEALPVLQEMLPDNYWTQTRKASIAGWIGLCYMLQGRDDAEAQLSKVITDHPNTQAADESCVHRALLRCERQAFDEALVDISTIKSAHLRHYAFGDYYRAQGRLAEAALHYEQVLPSLPPGYYGTYEQPYEALACLESIYRTLGNETAASAASAKKQEIYSEHIAPGA